MARKAKLNLTINAELKDKMRELAQKQAQKHGQSISGITTDLYSRLISGQRFFWISFILTRGGR